MDPISQALMMGASGSGGPKTYVEDVFSTWLYTGNGSTQTITNGVDLAGKGGLVWAKARSSAYGHGLFDTARGSSLGNARRLISNSTSSATTSNEDWVGFNSTGFTVNYEAGGQLFTQSGVTHASWTFREAEKFFDVVTYTGTGANRTISHNLGSVPGCIIVKRTNTTGDWQVYHRSLANTEYMVLNSTAAKATGATRWNSTTPTSTVFSLGTDATVNASGGTYVAYLFAHDAGGFGDSGNDSVVSCGTFTGNTTVTLGWEPQWILIKPTSTTGNWDLHDDMRGWPVSGDARRLKANLSDAEDGTAQIFPNATGFSTSIGSATYIYIAIRRGPMKTPTDATKVFGTITYTGNATANTARSTNILTDLLISTSRNESVRKVFFDRLRGAANRLASSETSAEIAQTSTFIGVSGFDRMDGYIAGADQNDGSVNYNTWTFANWAFRRAPGFFDVVGYAGDSTQGRTIPHNLGVSPELIIIKTRNAARNWIVYSAGVSTPSTSFMYLNKSDAVYGPGYTAFWNTAPTSTVFTVNYDGSPGVNYFGENHVAYLFATCPGVSKVGSYTGTGTTLNIDCGFTAGARFVLIKRTDSTGDWYVWDTARGIISGNDPYLLLNSTAAEVTNTDYIDPLNSGFQISSTAPAAINANGGSYIFLAIA
jgi:hypothetical protein